MKLNIFLNIKRKSICIIGNIFLLFIVVNQYIPQIFADTINPAACNCSFVRKTQVEGCPDDSLNTCWQDDRNGLGYINRKENGICFQYYYYCGNNNIPTSGNCACTLKEIQSSYFTTENACLGQNNIFENRCILPYSDSPNESGWKYIWNNGSCSYQVYSCSQAVSTPTPIPPTPTHPPSCNCQPAFKWNSGKSPAECHNNECLGPDVRDTHFQGEFIENNKCYYEEFLCASDGSYPLGDCSCNIIEHVGQISIEKAEDCLGPNLINNNRCIVPFGSNSNRSGYITSYQNGQCFFTWYACAPQITSSPTVTEKGSNYVVISWTTNVPTTSYIAFSDMSTGFDSPDPINWGKWRISKDFQNMSAMKKDHSIRIDYLQVSTQYYYRVSGRGYPQTGILIQPSDVNTFMINSPTATPTPEPNCNCTPYQKHPASQGWCDGTHSSCTIGTSYPGGVNTYFGWHLENGQCYMKLWSCGTANHLPPPGNCSCIKDSTVDITASHPIEESCIGVNRVLENYCQKDVMTGFISRWGNGKCYQDIYKCGTITPTPTNTIMTPTPTSVIPTSTPITTPSPIISPVQTGITPTPTQGQSCGQTANGPCCQNNTQFTCSTANGLYCNVIPVNKVCQRIADQNANQMTWDNILSNGLQNRTFDFDNNGYNDEVDFVLWLKAGKSL